MSLIKTKLRRRQCKIYKKLNQWRTNFAVVTEVWWFGGGKCVVSLNFHAWSKIFSPFKHDWVKKLSWWIFLKFFCWFFIYCWGQLAFWVVNPRDNYCNEMNASISDFLVTDKNKNVLLALLFYYSFWEHLRRPAVWKNLCQQIFILRASQMLP